MNGQEIAEMFDRHEKCLSRIAVALEKLGSNGDYNKRPPNLSELREKVNQLQALLDDPQPGLITWVQMYGERMKWISDFWTQG